jgi:DNA-binding MurR/RpiR family transcriptional regulator
VRSARTPEDNRRGQLDRAIDAPARSRMIYAFGSGGVSSWMVEEIHNRLFRPGLRITSSCAQRL